MQAIVLPALAGALCGYLLGVSKVAYTVVSLAIILGGYMAGKEHEGALQGALRGLAGGAIFGGFILLIHEATGKPPKASVPHPLILLMAITVVAGVILGALGGARRERQGEREKFTIDLMRLGIGELLAFAGAGVLALSLFLDWFATSCDSALKPTGCNASSLLNGMRGSFNAFETFKILQWVLVAACAAPFVLAYILIRSHELTWRPGEITMIVGMIAFALILVNGIIFGRPGEPPHNVEIGIRYGYYVGMAGAMLIGFGGFLRQARSVRGRKPPGVL
ncbi:MAG: hypothetical protein NVSMB25_06460 [Thermoleophilaceae bacterium]